MGNLNFGRTGIYSLSTHNGAGPHLTPTAAGVAGVSDSCSHCTHVPHGHLRAKLPDYIGQVFECKADNPELFT